MTLNSPETIMGHWTEYRNRVFGPKLGFHQERDCSLCFYAGLMEGILILSDISHRAPTEDIGAEQVEELIQNLKAVAFTVNQNRDPHQ